MQSITTKIRMQAALTTEERRFVANVRTLPVYRLLEWGVRQGVPDLVIADTDELVALTLAYQMLNDLIYDFVAPGMDQLRESYCRERIQNQTTPEIPPFIHNRFEEPFDLLDTELSRAGRFRKTQICHAARWIAFHTYDQSPQARDPSEKHLQFRSEAVSARPRFCPSW